MCMMLVCLAIHAQFSSIQNKAQEDYINSHKYYKVPFGDYYYIYCEICKNYVNLKDVYTIGIRNDSIYYMASKEGMNDLHLKKHTAEGICKYIPIKYDSIEQWSKNMADYLRSAMSYCNAKTLDRFISRQQYILLSNNAQNAINK